jgi:pimeloyl-ACP methyl ester carboxylesterase
MIYEQPVLYDYRLLQPPTLLIVGQEDHVALLVSYASNEVKGTLGHVAELAQDVIRQVPHGTLVIVPNAGHIPHLEQPAQFHKAVLSFLAEHAKN